MISLTRLNNQPLVVNSDLIKFIENTPDTVITLITGEKVVVLETVQQVLDQIVDFRRRLSTPPIAITLASEEGAPQTLAEDETG
jgi:flagellar protein FlbD